MIIVKKIRISSEKVEIVIRKEYLREKVIKYWAFNKEIKEKKKNKVLLKMYKHKFRKRQVKIWKN